MNYQYGLPSSMFTGSVAQELSNEVSRHSAAYTRWLQSSLNKILNLRLSVDGQMGAQTRSALRRFQQRAGLKADADPGARTEQALLAAGATPPPRTSNSPNRPATPITPATPTTPALLNRETAPPTTTLYVGITLGSEKPAPAMTGIFIPQHYQPQEQVDLILYLHGHKTGKQVKPTTAIEQYWRAPGIPTFPLREKLNETRQNVLLVAPTLSPKSGAGWLVQPGGLDKYLDAVLAALRAHGGLRRTPRLGHLILACHSGGGYPMRTLALSSNNYARRIKECWGFDCTYNGGDEVLWSRWARSRPDARLFIYYIKHSPTAPKAEALARTRTPNVAVLTSPVTHNWVPIKHWRERIEAANFLRTV